MPAAANLMLGFRACPVPDRWLFGGLPADKLYNLLACVIPWWQGKMQGISPIQPFSSNIRLENICKFSRLRENSLRSRARNSFRLFDRRREFGAKSILARRIAVERRLLLWESRPRTRSGGSQSMN